jgi:sec-independent protein translocase protein TatC
MSFGEHLEELRKVLVRALIGVAIACVIGFMFANQTIQVLKQPLVDAIKQYNIEDANAELVSRYGYIPPEYSSWMKEGVIPRQVKTEPEQIVRAIQSIIPNFGAVVDLEPYGFRANRFTLENLPALCKRLSTQTGYNSATPEKLNAIWERSPAADQQTVLRVAESSEATNEDLAEIVAVFNRLSKVDSLSDAAAFEEDLTEPKSSFWTIFAPPKEKPLAKMKEKLVSEPDAALNRRLNRALICSQFTDLMPPLKTDLVSFEFFEDSEFEPQALGVGEGFSVWLKAGLFSGLVLAGPWVAYQIWMFVGSGLYPHEKKYMHMFLPISIALFVAGVLLAFYFVFQPVLGFLFSFNRSMGIAPQMRINDWLSFVMFLPLGFGIAFQLPLVMLFMNRIGLFTVEVYMSKWRIAVMVIFVIAMLLTPADPISMLLLAVPLTFLYFLGVAMCRWMPTPTNPFGEESTVAT